MDYFKKYLEVAPLSHAIWRAKEAQSLEKLVKVSGGSFLDLGCGFGEFAGVFFDGLVEVGIDISRSDLLLAASRKKYRRLVWADARKMPFSNNSFEKVISISVLEHIKDIDLVFREVYRILRKGGIFIFSVPTEEINKKLLGARISRKIGLGFLEKIYIKIFHYSLHHCNVFSKNRWLTIAERAGFKVIESFGTIASNQLLFFELFLPFALPTQLFRKFFNKRLLFSPQVRVNILSTLFEGILKEGSNEDINIMVVLLKE